MRSQLSKKELISFMLFCWGTALFYQFATNYISIFATDLGITAASVAFIAAIAQIWDAVNDPIFGTMVDNIHLKSGKYKPWIKMASIFLPLSALFLFTLPMNLSPRAKFIWVLIGYIVYRTAFTMADIPQFGMVNVLTKDVQERNVIMGVRNISGILAVTLVAVAGPFMYMTYGWAKTGILFAVIGFIMMFPLHRVIKEKVHPSQGSHFKFTEVIGIIKSNRFFIIFFLGVIISQATNAILIILAYFSRYCLGSDALTTLVFLLVLIPTFVVATLLPALQAKVDKYHLLMISLIGSAVLGIIHYFMGYSNFIVFCIMMLIRGIFIGSQAMLIFTFTPNIVEYGHFKTGRRVEALYFSLQTFCSKMTAAFCSAITLMLLDSAGFIEGAGAIQPESVPQMLWFFMTIFPAIGVVISLIPFSKYKLRDTDIQIMTEVNLNLISKEEGLKKLKQSHHLNLDKDL